MADMRRCGIIGAGSVGAASAYTLAVSGLFSEVVLLDADENKAEGEAADIAHGAALGRPCRVYAGKYEDFADCGLVILAAGANQRPGETREALLGRNREILRSILEQLTRVNREAILLVVANRFRFPGFRRSASSAREPSSTRRGSSAFSGAGSAWTAATSMHSCSVSTATAR